MLFSHVTTVRNIQWFFFAVILLIWQLSILPVIPSWTAKIVQLKLVSLLRTKLNLISEAKDAQILKISFPL